MEDSKITKLEIRLAKMNTKIKKERMRQAKIKRERLKQTKELIGHAVLLRMKAKDGKASWLYQWCRDALSDKDKARLDAGIGQPTEH